MNNDIQTDCSESTGMLPSIPVYWNAAQYSTLTHIKSSLLQMVWSKDEVKEVSSPVH